MNNDMCRVGLSLWVGGWVALFRHNREKEREREYKMGIERSISNNVNLDLFVCLLMKLLNVLKAVVRNLMTIHAFWTGLASQPFFDLHIVGVKAGLITSQLY